MGSVTAQLQLLQQLEGQLLKLRKEKSFVDPALKDARKQFRSTAEAILLVNYRTGLVRLLLQMPISALSSPSQLPRQQSKMRNGGLLQRLISLLQEKGIETKLWHLCFHRPVQEFRRRIQEQTSKGEKGKELVAKVKHLFMRLEDLIHQGGSKHHLCMLLQPLQERHQPA